MFLNFDLNSLSDEALSEKIAQVLKCMSMINYGNAMSYESLSSMLDALYYEQQMRTEARLTNQIIAKSKAIDTENRSAITKKIATKKTSEKKGGVSMAKPSFTRSKSPTSDNI